jgi:hypothetical protein
MNWDREALLAYIEEKTRQDHIAPLLWQCAKGLDDPRTWGLFKITTAESLQGRKFDIIGPQVGQGDKPGIFFTDVWYDPRAMKFIAKEEK